MTQTPARQRPPARHSQELIQSDEESRSSDLLVPSQVAAVQQEIQASMIVARQFPRSEDDARGRLMRTCDSKAFCMTAMYSYPRSNKLVDGPTVWLMREAARVWKHIDYGFRILQDDEVGVHLRGYAWDMQDNNRATQDVYVKKLIQRKVADGKTVWVVPDERDLLELVNRVGAKASRNCIRHILPAQMIDDVLVKCRAVLKSEAEKHPDRERYALIDSFAKFGVMVPDLESYLDHPVAQLTPDELVDLRGIYSALRDGGSWKAFLKAKAEPAEGELPSVVEPPKVAQEMTLEDLVKPETT